jgi:membrane associated rhomboid family serine protease
VEEALGSARYLLFYAVIGVRAGLLQVATTPASQVPLVGASGAIAGVLGGYALLFPRARIQRVLVRLVFVQLIDVPAWIWLGLWLGAQVVSALLAGAQQVGVAWFAHVGGFVAGLLRIRAFVPARKRGPAPSRHGVALADNLRRWS